VPSVIRTDGLDVADPMSAVSWASIAAGAAVTAALTLALLALGAGLGLSSVSLGRLRGLRFDVQDHGRGVFGRGGGYVVFGRWVFGCSPPHEMDWRAY